MRGVRTALAALWMALAGGVAFAQSGGITVKVVDQDGVALPGATVTISHELNFVKETSYMTDANGVVEFPVLRPGTGYRVQVAFPGYASISQDEIRVRINSKEPVAVQMLEEITEKVTVTATREVVSLDTTESATKFSDDFIADLPVQGRFYQNVLVLAPGVQDSDNDGNPNVHGSRDRDFKAVVSGISNVDPLTGQFMSNVNPNSIEEMEVVTAGAGVEFGGAQGGFATIIQKQGSNDLEGVVEFLYRTSRLDGDGAGRAFASETQDLNFDSIQPSIQLSGPLVKDKLWYVLSHEMIDTQNPALAADGIATRDIESFTHFDRLTWQVSSRNKLSFDYQSNPRDVSNADISSTVPVESSQFQEFDGTTYSVAWDAPYSPKVFVRSVVGWTEGGFNQGPTTAGLRNACVSGFLDQAECVEAIKGNRRSGSFFQLADDERQRFTISGTADVFGTRFLGVSHQLKLGIQVENSRYFRDLTQGARMRVSPTNVLDSTDEIEPALTASVTVAVPGQDDDRTTGLTWAAYLQDEFKPRQNVSITLGARVDRTEINSEGFQQFDPLTEFAEYSAKPPWNGIGPQPWVDTFTGYEAVEDFRAALEDICGNFADPGVCLNSVDRAYNPQNNETLFQHRRADDISITNTDFSPYLAVGYSPGSTGKTALKMTAGRHYNNLPLTLPLQELQPTQANLTYRITQENGENVIQASRPTTPVLDVQILSRDLATPYNDEFTLSLERELWTETSLTVRYINRKFRDQIQDINVNQNTGDFGTCARANGGGFEVKAAPGVGNVTDAFSNETYADTIAGDGDGRIDDCAGNTVGFTAGGATTDTFVQEPDGITDLYVQNPFWGDIFLIGNFNEIDYEAYELVLNRRQYRGWEMTASYTWSEAIGDGEDFFQELGDDPSLRANVSGYQSYDQRHVVKLNATTITPWGIRMGGSVTWQSGLPYSILTETLSEDIIPPNVAASLNAGDRVRTRQRYSDVDGNSFQRNSERNESYWLFNVRAAKELNLGRGLNMQLAAEIFDLFDQGTYRVYNSFTEAGQQVNGVNEADPLFGRSWQLSMRVQF